MAAAAESNPSGHDKPAPKSRKKLILIIGAEVLLLVAGVGAFLVLGSGSIGGSKPKTVAPAEPTYLPLETFTVNLVEQETERYALIGVTLELRHKKDVDRFKAFMPAIRSQMLLAMTKMTAAELLAPDGKRLLAQELTRAAAIGLDPGAAQASASGAEGEADDGPVVAVHFSNFIIQ